MASSEELQDELVRQSSRLLDAEHERARLDEQVRKLLRENGTLREELTVQREENGLLTRRVEEVESEVADLSSSLVEQANVQVSEANRRAAAAQRLVVERDTLLEVQAVELQEIKRMMARQEEAAASAAPRQRGPKRARRPSFSGKLDADVVLDLDSYASPVRPVLRTDTREFRDFLEIFPAEGGARPFHFALEALEAPAWRRSRFVTKLIQEDIEPTLRLDRAAHMNWLTCRAFLTAVLEQTLILEPVSASERPWAHRPSHPCLLCGESRGELIYSRYFWARTSPDAEPLVLDLACLVRVRLACELVGFIRSITDGKPGHTREQQEQAYRECASLREQLFWARVGGLYPEAGDDDENEEISESHALEKMPSARGTPIVGSGGFGSPAIGPTNSGDTSVNSLGGARATPVADSPMRRTHATSHGAASPVTSRRVASTSSPRSPEVPVRSRRSVSDRPSAADPHAAPDASPRTSSAIKHANNAADVANDTNSSAAAFDSTNTTDTASYAGTAAGTGTDTSATDSGAAAIDRRPANGALAPIDTTATDGSISTTSKRSATLKPSQMDRNNGDDAEALAVSTEPTGPVASATTYATSPETTARAAAREGTPVLRPESEEFHFDTDEFHSPAASPQRSAAASREPSPEPAPREAMPGGWPG